MRAMISQPMAGKTNEEIAAVKERAIKVLAEKGYDVIDTFFRGEWYDAEVMGEMGVQTIPLFLLAKSLEGMSHADAVYFCKGWERYRGCVIEHDAAKAYDLTILYE